MTPGRFAAVVERPSASGTVKYRSGRSGRKPRHRLAGLIAARAFPDALDDHLLPLNAGSQGPAGASDAAGVDQDSARQLPDSRAMGVADDDDLGLRRIFSKNRVANWGA